MKPMMNAGRRVLALAAMAALAVMTLAASATAAEFEITAASMTIDYQVNVSSWMTIQKTANPPGNPANYTGWGANNAGGLYFDGAYKVWDPVSTGWVSLSTATGGTLSGGSTPWFPYWTNATTLGNSQLARDGGASLSVAGSSLTVYGNMALSGANTVLTSSGVAAVAGQAGVFFSTSVYLTGTSSVTAGYFLGNGAGLTNVSGTLSGGTANAVPYWTGANSQGNSQMIRDSANSMTVGGSSLTVTGQTRQSGSVEVASATLTLNGTGAGLTVLGSVAATISPSASVTIGPSGASSDVNLQPGRNVVISPANMSNGLTVKQDGTNVVGFWQGSYEMFKFKQ